MALLSAGPLDAAIAQRACRPDRLSLKRNGRSVGGRSSSARLLASRVVNEICDRGSGMAAARTGFGSAGPEERAGGAKRSGGEQGGGLQSLPVVGRLAIAAASLKAVAVGACRAHSAVHALSSALDGAQLRIARWRCPCPLRSRSALERGWRFFAGLREGGFASPSSRSFRLASRFAPGLGFARLLARPLGLLLLAHTSPRARAWRRRPRRAAIGSFSRRGALAARDSASTSRGVIVVAA